MDSTVIDTILRKNCSIYRGIYSIDNLPNITLTSRPLVIVANTDPSSQPGQHWICMYFNEGRCEFFDSFGRRPMPTFERYMNRLCRAWVYNDRQLQSIISRFCGHYCIKKSQDVLTIIWFINLHVVWFRYVSVRCLI